MFSDYNYGGVPQDAIDQLKQSYDNPYSGISSLPRNYARYKKAPYNGPFQTSSYQLKSEQNFSGMMYQPNIHQTNQSQQYQYQSQSQQQTPNIGNQYYQYQSPQPQGQNYYQQNDYQPQQQVDNSYAQEMERHMQEKRRKEVKERKAPTSDFVMQEKSDKQSSQNSFSNKFQGSKNMQQYSQKKQPIDLNNPEYEDAMNKFFSINEQEKYVPKFKPAAETYKVYNILSHNRQVEYNPKFEFFVKNENPNDVNQELLKRKEKNKALETKERTAIADKNYGDDW